MAGFRLNILNMPKKLETVKGSLEGIGTPDLEPEILGSCERFQEKFNEESVESDYWWAAEEKPKPEQPPTNRMFVFKAADKVTVVKAHIHLNHPSVKLDRILNITETLPDTCELHVFYTTTLTPFMAAAVMSAMARTKAKVISHLVKVCGLTTLVTAMTATEVKVSSGSLICLNHKDEGVYGIGVQDLLNSANYTVKRRDGYLKQLLDAKLFTQEEVDDFTKKDNVLVLFGEELDKRIQNVQPLKK